VAWGATIDVIRRSPANLSKWWQLGVDARGARAYQPVAAIFSTTISVVPRPASRLGAGNPRFPLSRLGSVLPKRTRGSLLAATFWPREVAGADVGVGDPPGQREWLELLVLSGVSGAGKSSLLRAGVLRGSAEGSSRRRLGRFGTAIFSPRRHAGRIARQVAPKAADHVSGDTANSSTTGSLCPHRAPDRSGCAGRSRAASATPSRDRGGW